MARITEDEGKNLVVRVELIDEGRLVENTHDLVVLSVGMLPGYDAGALCGVPADAADGFMEAPEFNISPCLTRQPGIFATGTATAPMDIVDSIVMASAAAAEAAAWIEGNGGEVPAASSTAAGMAERSA